MKTKIKKVTKQELREYIRLHDRICQTCDGCRPNKDGRCSFKEGYNRNKLKPILEVRAKVCFKDEDGMIFEQQGVLPYGFYVEPNEEKEQEFIGKIGNYKVKVTFIN